jgi:hypothetical protein
MYIIEFYVSLHFISLYYTQLQLCFHFVLTLHSSYAFISFRIIPFHSILLLSINDSIILFPLHFIHSYYNIKIINEKGIIISIHHLYNHAKSILLLDNSLASHHSIQAMLSFHSVPLYYTPFDSTLLHSTSFYYVSLRFIMFHFISLRSS